MSLPLEDYALIGDTQSAALVGRDGSIDWLCLPRFDSAACFAALLGTADNGRWQLAPRGASGAVRRRYRDNSLVLETEFSTPEGVVRVIDLMPVRDRCPDVVRIVEGVSGRVDMRMDLTIRFDYGQIVPWVRKLDGRLHAIAGPDALILATGVTTRGENLTTVAEFAVSAGDQVPFVLTWCPSYGETPDSIDPLAALDDTDRWWRQWVARGCPPKQHRDEVVRSLITLKALTYGPTGGIVAAATTSLPETIGGERNWDYRFAWLRDATFSLYALMNNGYREEAAAWRDWLLRAVAGDPSKLQTMYGVAGERRLDEREVQGLCGYEGSRPVRIGNAAAGQLQLDVYGEVIDTLYQARHLGLPHEPAEWNFERALLSWLETGWNSKDEGLWEVRAERRNFTHSKVMAWVAMDRAVKAIEHQGMEGPVERFRALRDEIHREVCKRGFDSELGTFTQSYGAKVVDASLLLMPAVGFLPGSDRRVIGTVAAVERELLRDGFVQRYPTAGGQNLDGLSGAEGAFLACSFWLADAYALVGRRADALALYDRLLAVRNDVGLLSEEYDVTRRRLVGNFPQAFSHVALVNTARNLADASGPAKQRRGS
ncbi:MAG: glycoside hydrolase family 15 protein [Myxococcales bacterium]